MLPELVPGKSKFRNRSVCRKQNNHARQYFRIRRAGVPVGYDLFGRFLFSHCLSVREYSVPSAKQPELNIHNHNHNDDQNDKDDHIGAAAEKAWGKHQQ